MSKILASSLIAVLCTFSVVSAQENSLIFDGVNDKVTVPDNDLFNNANTLTIEAWINADVWKPQVWQGTIVGKDQDPQTGYVLRCGNNGRLSFTIGDGQGNWAEVASGPVMDANTWNHVAGVMDNGELRIYINGSLEGTASSNPIATSTSQLIIGESPGFSGRYFEGKIDEVRIWNVVRSQEQIQDNSTIDLPANEPGLVAYYKFNQVSGNTTPNHIDTENTVGTLVNFPADPWGPGYVGPGMDVRAVSISSPNILSLYEGSTRVKMKIRNSGVEEIESFSLGYKIGDAEAHIENVILNLQPDEEFEHAFENIIPEADLNTTIKVFATAEGDLNTNNDTTSYFYQAPSPLDPTTIPIFVNELHNFAAAGQSKFATIPMPENNSMYSQIIMNISLSCPLSGCDPWDQPAKISLTKNGEVYELARYITPYGIACGPWTVDVTSFKSVLQGSCEFTSYIQVWGQSGWKLNASLTFVEEESEFPFQNLTALWDTDNWVYGDPDISYDLPDQEVSINENTLETEFRMTNTGHGQGNTQNAAEFSNKTHELHINGNTFAEHHLWKDDCGENECSNQNGTWLYSRAGWCPGQAVDPFFSDISDEAEPGTAVNIDYVLQDYTNFLNSGYNGSSHTEPHYKIHAYLVEKSDVFIESENYLNLAAHSILFPQSPGDLSESTVVTLLLKNDGSEPIEFTDLHLYLNGDLMVTEVSDLSLNTGESVEYTFAQVMDLDPEQNYTIAVMVDTENDQAASDDVSSIYIGATVGINENDQLHMTAVYPNPNNGNFTIKLEGENSNVQLSIFDLYGKTVHREIVNGNELMHGKNVISELSSGLYLLKLSTGTEEYYKKLLVQ